MAQRKNKENLIFEKSLNYSVAFNNVPFWVFLNIPQNVKICLTMDRQLEFPGYAHLFFQNKIFQISTKGWNLTV